MTTNIVAVCGSKLTTKVVSKLELDKIFNGQFSVVEEGTYKVLLRSTAGYRAIKVESDKESAEELFIIVEGVTAIKPTQTGFTVENKDSGYFYTCSYNDNESLNLDVTSS
ncbi:hypothetical protein [Moritella sp. F3]|uniref:hypothetical protein n=1 Tax=Moritella sp. F3 TaxID=2718882 RepID=UPI0018E189B8|nr:hypothetical protein [Moritella sp. F3]GIC77708.1 hypothetical protein FMO001_24350 [Moritella sp. F1]GIC82121.1 hypothetical protein FMO003_24020 [Moritella sp. F3]